MSNQQQIDRLINKADLTHPVLVTGVDGYVAGVLVRELLRAGFIVHGTHPKNYDATKQLRDLFSPLQQQPNQLKLFPADLLEPNSFDVAMKDCRIVFHLASPFLLRHGLDPHRDLLQPAVQGTRNVLQSAAASASHVRRVVLTSSVAAIYGDATDSSADHILTAEDDWNRTSTPNHQPYFLSKTCAEQAAWVIAGSQTKFTMVALNPALILGPGIQYRATSESFRTIHKIGGGHWSMWFGCPHLAMPAVDVRDVAAAHIIAALDDSIQGRHIVAAKCAHLTEFAFLLAEAFPQYPIPRISALVPRWAAWLVLPYMRQGLDRATVWRNLNVDLYLQPSKQLPIHYRPLKETLVDMYQQMIDAGAVKPGPRPEWNGLALVVGGVAVLAGLWVRFGPY